MAVNLGAAFEQELLALAGLAPGSIDPGSSQIDLVNPDGGPTTVRATIVATVPTPALKSLIQKYTT